MKCKQGVYRFLNRFMFLCAATLTLASCGGGGGSSPEPVAPATPTLTGLAATGGALAGASVTAKCASGPSVAGTTGTDGTFSLPLAAGQAVPCLLQVVSGTITLHGFAAAVGYTNVTPLTELVIIRALGSSAAAAFASFDASKGASIRAGLDDAKIYVIAQVTPLAGAPTVDILTGVFKIDDDNDKVLIKLKTALDDSGKKFDDFGNAAASGGSLTAVVTRQTWYYSDGAALTANQVTSFDAQGLYYNVHSTENPNGEIRGQIVPSSAAFLTDNGDPATGNTFSALMSGAQEVPANASKASAYGTVVLDPVAKTISGVIVTSGISSILAHIHNGVPGVSGPVIFPFTGGPTVWTMAPTAISDAQIDLLRGGAYYLNVHSNALPAGELRGQLTQRTRFAELNIGNEPVAIAPALPSSGTGVLALATTPLANGNFPISGFVQTKGIVNAVAAHIHEGAAGPGSTGPVIVPITETPVGSGLWVVPAGSTLTPSQVLSFNTGTLYYNVHTALNPGGEIRGPILAADVKIGNATLTGANEVPAVTTAASGTGIITVNSITRQVQGNISTSGIVGIAAHVHEDPVNLVGPVIVPMTLTAPVTTIQPPLAVSTTALAGGTVGAAYSQTLAATGGTAPYTWTVSAGTLPDGLSLSTAGVISGPPTTAGSSSFTVTVTDSATPAATATKALSIDIAAAAAATVSFASQVQPIFNASCVICHVQGGLATFMPLSTGTAYASLFQPSLQAGVLRVVAGNSAASPLYLRLIGTSIGNLMPLGGPPLSAANQTLIKDWIDQGAPNN